MAKKKQSKVKAARVKIVLPVVVAPDQLLPEVVEVVPVHVDQVDTVLLPEAVGPVRCILTLKETLWFGVEYVVLTAAAGHQLPALLRTGQEVEVHFSPPSPVSTQ